MKKANSKYDTNKDGFIQLDELTNYMQTKTDMIFEMEDMKKLDTSSFKQ